MEKFTTLKKNTIIAMSILIFGWSVTGIWVLWLFGYTGGRITQKADTLNREPVISTLVWYDGIIIESWYDPISEMSEKEIENRKEEAENLLSKIKNID